MNATPIKISHDDAQQKLSSKLSEIELKEKEKLVEGQAEVLGLPYISLNKFPISHDALKLINQGQAEALQTVCFFYSGDEIRLASLNPNNPQVAHLTKELAEKYHANVVVYFVSENSFDSAYAIYQKIPSIIQMEGVQIGADDLAKFDAQIKDFASLQKLIAETNLTELVNITIATALKFEASDIHIETEEKGVKLRLRVDGVLHDVAALPLTDFDKISSRIKLLAGLKMNIGDKPQDGRFTITAKGDKIDVRVSVIPSAYGESIVLRILRASSVGFVFEDLGLRGKAFNDLENEMKKPNGMIMATGPTGSGKTTTLYAVLNTLNQPDTKIITLEDPIEYKLPGIVQSQVENAEIETDLEPGESQGSARKAKPYTFARGLKAILRQDPDIVMVGEVRDLETAETAINAALTGHLMLSTMHTNSAAGAIPRFLAMGVKSFLLAPALNAIIGQRLVRRLCLHCKIEDETIDNKTITDVLNALNQIAPESGYKPADLANVKFYTAKGCDQCHGLGYKGRMGLFEVFTINNEVEKIILSGEVSEFELQKTAIKNGMITMFQDGLLKAMAGLTSVQEVLRQTQK
ncbi:MAG: hypothetical protein C3F02_02145 [Parcubacteria group bacterium]|nr:MAG: hypothetical protein C3F02_02145 [Parcubacteria group bacterium]